MSRSSSLAPRKLTSFPQKRPRNRHKKLRFES
jgi:hypothetical protein